MRVYAACNLYAGGFNADATPHASKLLSSRNGVSTGIGRWSLREGDRLGIAGLDAEAHELAVNLVGNRVVRGAVAA